MPQRQLPDIPILPLVLLLGTALRLILAAATFLEYRPDTVMFQLWGFAAIEHGLQNIFSAPLPTHPEVLLQPLDYPPAYLYVLWGLEYIRRWLGSWWLIGSPLTSLLFKLPVIVCEVATGWLLAKIVEARAGRRWGEFAALVYLFSPVTILTTALWGQIDAVISLLIVATIWQLERRKITAAVIIGTVAVLTKLQAIIFAPLFLIYLLAERWKKLWGALAVSIMTAILICLPFVMSEQPWRFLSAFTSAVGRYPKLTVDAVNIWWLMTGGLSNHLSDGILIFGLPLRWIGLGLMSAAIILACRFMMRSNDPDRYWIGAVFLVFSFYLLPTEIHERYLFSIFALLVVLLPRGASWQWLCALLTITYTINVSIVLYGPHPINLPAFCLLYLAAFANVCGYLWFTTRIIFLPARSVLN